MLSEECHLQLPRRPIVTARGQSKKPGPAIELSQSEREPIIHKPAVDLSRSKGPPLILTQHLWHPTDALDHLFDWMLRFSHGDTNFPAAPPGVYSRFHPVELVDYLKLQDVGLFVGAHQFFMTTNTAKIAEFTAPSAARTNAKAMQATLGDLDLEHRKELVETVALAVTHKRLAAIPQIFKVDLTLCDDIKEAMTKSQLSQELVKAQSRESNSAVEGTSSDSEELDAQEESSPIRVLVESFQTGRSSGEPADTDVESLASSATESMFG